MIRWGHVFSVINSAIPALLIATPALATPLMPKGCEVGENAILHYEKLATQALATSGVAVSQDLLQPIQCLIHNFKVTTGFTRNVAYHSLEAVLAAQRNPDLMQDPAYKQLALFLTETAEQDKAMRELIVGGYAKGMGGYYKMFCDEGDADSCSRMLPDTKLILGQASMISAGSVYLIKEIYTSSNQETKELLITGFGSSTVGEQRLWV